MKEFTLGTLLRLQNPQLEVERAMLIHQEIPHRLRAATTLLHNAPFELSKFRLFREVVEAYRTLGLRVSKMPEPTTAEDARASSASLHRMLKAFRIPLFTGGFETRALAIAIAELRQSHQEEWHSSGMVDTMDKFAAELSTLRISSKLLIDHACAGNHRRNLGVVHRNYDPRRCASTTVSHAHNLVEKLGNECPDIQIRLHSEAFPEHATLGLVPTHVQYVLIELVKNALQATLDNAKGSRLPPVTVDILQSEELTTFTVCDAGAGIPAETLPHIWSYAYTSTGVHPSEVGLAQMTISGCGVGLALSRTYARYFGGSLKLHETSADGSTFVLEIPHHINAHECLPAAGIRA